MTILSMADLDLTGKRVLIRVDFNVPVKDGCVANAKRIQAVLPTIRLALGQNAGVVLLSHFGRPKEGEFNQDQSLQPVVDYLNSACKLPVRLEKNWLDGLDVNAGEVVLCENVRFEVGEKANDDQLAKKMAKLCDVFVMDAFGAAHRAHASTQGVAKFAPLACAGMLLKKELNSLEQALSNPQRPVIAIVGGAKVSTKLAVLKTLLNKVDQLIVGGGIANTFLAAAGEPIGQSLCEAGLIETAKQLLAEAQSRHTEIPLPEDVVCAKEFSETATAQIKSSCDVQQDDLILDIGPAFADRLAKLIQGAGTIVWNGPVGVFEFEAFANGTQVMAQAIGKSQAFSIAGGGDTLAAVDQFGLEEQISYISTGGGAFLEYLEGRPLPAVEILKERART